MAEEIYIASYDGDVLKSNECLPKEKCGDSDWWFNEHTKTFNRYYTYYHLLEGTLTEYEEVKAEILNTTNP